MKKIMFNDKYGLTAAVLNGDKTMTRRIIPLTDVDRDYLDNAFDWDLRESVIIDRYAQYKAGEIVAVAQSYETLANSGYLGMMTVPADNAVGFEFKLEYCGGGYKNKMFVRADLMPHHIEMTAVKIERLQDIGNEDAMREGVFKYEEPPLFHEFDPYAPWPPYVKPYKHDHDNLKYFCEARFAFAHLIDRVSRIGMWNVNPYVLAYSFILID